MSQRPKPAVLFPSPRGSSLEVPRKAVAARCAECGAEHQERYRLLRVTGWVEVTRCPECLHIEDEMPAPTPLGFTYTPYAAYLRDSR